MTDMLMRLAYSDATANYLYTGKLRMIKLTDDELIAALKSNIEKMLRLLIQMQDSPLKSKKLFEDFKEIIKRYQELLESKTTY
jgi:hypothetical protein